MNFVVDIGTEVNVEGRVVARSRPALREQGPAMPATRYAGLLQDRRESLTHVKHVARAMTRA